MSSEQNLMNDPKVADQLRAMAEKILQQVDQNDIPAAFASLNEMSDVREHSLYQEIGSLTRSLHDSIRDFTIDDTGAAVTEICDASDGLSYIVEMTNKSANYTMDLVEAGIPLVDNLCNQSEELLERWKKLLKKDLSIDDYKKLSDDLSGYLEGGRENLLKVRGQLSEIILAQNYQDLTGQVIQRVSAMVKDVELRLVEIISIAAKANNVAGVEFEKTSKVVDEPDIKAEGPQINPSDEKVVANQNEVDDLLSSLGF